MRPEDIEKYPPMRVTLKNETEVIIRALSPNDGEALGDFYDAVPREDQRFYCPHPLDRDHAWQNAGKAHSPLEVVLVLETAIMPIAGYAWYRWGAEDAEKSTFGICIGRPLQGTGAGRAMMERLNEIAAVIGPPVMSLTVQQANPRAVDLYRKMGFEIISEQMRGPVAFLGYGPEAEYCMERRVR